MISQYGNTFDPEATMAAGCDQGRPQQAPCHGAKNSRSAEAQAVC